jgi:hypothetical protein
MGLLDPLQRVLCRNTAVGPCGTGE